MSFTQNLIKTKGLVWGLKLPSPWPCRGTPWWSITVLYRPVYIWMHYDHPTAKGESLGLDWVQGKSSTSSNLGVKIKFQKCNFSVCIPRYIQWVSLTFCIIRYNLIYGSIPQIKAFIEFCKCTEWPQNELWKFSLHMGPMLRNANFLIFFVTISLKNLTRKTIYFVDK